MMKRINKVCVFCAASNNVDNIYYEEAFLLGQLLAESGRDIMYGGGSVGLMGRLADGAISKNGKVTGVIPEFLDNLELGHKRIDKMHVVDSMHTRKNKLLKESDCIIALPGGCGTFEELLEAITWKRLGLIISPVIIVNIKNYYDPLIEMLERSIREKFMREEYHKTWVVVQNAREAIDIINNDLEIHRFEEDTLIKEAEFAKNNK
jgi:uncharacterized protein (TIGR00730 family)